MMAAEGKSVSGHQPGSGRLLSARQEPATSSNLLRKKIEDAGCTISAVCRRAGVTDRHFRKEAGADRPASRWFIRRCELALQSLVSGEGMPAEPSEIHLRAHYRAFLHQLGVELGVAEAELRSPAPRGQAAVARHAAWYLLSTEFAVRPARIADLFGVTRAAATQALQTTEDRRDDPAFDRALETIGARIIGRT